MIEIINAKGHKNIRAKHKTTLEITKENHLTPRGDCIVGISADKGMLELSDEFKKKLRNENSILEIEIECCGIKEKIIAYGNSKLILEHPTDMVVRKSDFICNRTLAVKADKAACDLDRKLVENLRNGKDIIVKLRIR